MKRYNQSAKLSDENHLILCLQEQKNNWEKKC